MTLAGTAAPVLVSSQQANRRAFPKPNFGRIHARPLPLTTYPLPPLIPHNPFSVLQIAFTYVLQLINRPLSHAEASYKAHWSYETRSVHVTDEMAIRALWECGFFGKGTLSRSEPRWLDREKRRKGLLAKETAEEYTIQRREERKKFKNERAKLQREAIDEKLKEEKSLEVGGHVPELTTRAKYEDLNGGPVDSLADTIESLDVEEPLDPPMPAPVLLASFTEDLKDLSLEVSEEAVEQPNIRTQEEIDADIAATINLEDLQFAPYEAFFLAYGLGVLSIHDQDLDIRLSTSEIFDLFRRHSYFPPLPTSSLQPDDPFLISYTSYHHFRSLGWVVRPGIKFSVDWLLYIRGPVFAHAEFAVIVLPAYTHSYWRSTPELEKATRKKENKSWWWLHCVNRVQSQAKKTLVLLYVDVPPPSALPTPNAEGVFDIGMFLEQYKVREFTLKRWISNRERD